ncbi:hypothetical protein AAY473_006529 [Plecturocebus cupreus]
MKKDRKGPIAPGPQLMMPNKLEQDQCAARSKLKGTCGLTHHRKGALHSHGEASPRQSALLSSNTGITKTDVITFHTRQQSFALVTQAGVQWRNIGSQVDGIRNKTGPRQVGLGLCWPGAPRCSGHKDCLRAEKSRDWMVRHPEHISSPRVNTVPSETIPEGN